MPKVQKFGVVSLFIVGIILIAVATPRVTQVGSMARSLSMPSSSWIAFWGVVECSIAMIIECRPAYFILIHNHITPAVSYNTQGFVRQKGGDSLNSDDIRLAKFMEMGSNTRKSVGVSSRSALSKDVDFNDVHGSQFERPYKLTSTPRVLYAWIVSLHMPRCTLLGPRIHSKSETKELVNPYKYRLLEDVVSLVARFIWGTKLQNGTWVSMCLVMTL
jgi:hypothetical protein